MLNSPVAAATVSVLRQGLYHGGDTNFAILLATGTVLCKAAIDRGIRLSTGRYGCRQLKKHQIRR